MSTPRTVIDGLFAEKATAIITATVQDNASPPAPIAGSSLTTMTLTLYDEKSGTILNSKNGTDVKASVNESGVLTLTLTPDDMVIVNERAHQERHIALLKWTWSGGTGAHEIAFDVVNMGYIS